MKYGVTEERIDLILCGETILNNKFYHCYFCIHDNGDCSLVLYVSINTSGKAVEYMIVPLYKTCVIYKEESGWFFNKKEEQINTVDFYNNY